MSDDEDVTRYPADPYGINRQKFQNVNYPQSTYAKDDDIDEEEVEEEDIHNEVDDEDGGGGGDDDDDDDDGGNGVQRIGQDDYEGGDDDDDDDEDEDDEYADSQKHPKKRKLKSLMSSYEFAPRVPPPSSAYAPAPKPSYGGRNPLTDWTERESFILLDAWGDRFLKQGRKSLRSEEWQEVAERVSQESRIERTDTQCRNRLDTLKKKYKKEKMKLGEGEASSASKWVYFKKMDTLLSPLQQQQAGLSCGVDSGEYVFMNPKVYLNHSNGLDEMRDSPGNSESVEAEEDETESRVPKGRNNGPFFKMLADSIQKFSNIYKKIESSRREQMVELEKMRMDFHRDLEMQKRQILERARAEIARIRQGDDEDNDVSGDNNVSG